MCINRIMRDGTKALDYIQNTWNQDTSNEAEMCARFYQQKALWIDVTSGGLRIVVAQVRQPGGILQLELNSVIKFQAC